MKEYLKSKEGNLYCCKSGLSENERHIDADHYPAEINNVNYCEDCLIEDFNLIICQVCGLLTIPVSYVNDKGEVAYNYRICEVCYSDLEAIKENKFFLRQVGKGEK